MKSLLNFKTLVFLTAMFITGCAALFSVTGIGKLFAGSSLAVLVMASSLELGKVVSISFLYRYWTDIGHSLKMYLMTASVVLMLITSMGIYGYLSGAYQQTADKVRVMDQQTSILTLKKERYEEQRTQFMQERERLSTSVSELSRGLANNVIQYRDSASGQILTSTSSATRTALQRQLTSATAERDRLGGRIEALADSITAIDIQVMDVNNDSELAAEVGPLRFVSGITGLEMSTVVNVFTIMIVLVFDPLAVALIIAFNFLHKKEQGGEEPPTEGVVDLPPEIPSPEVVSSSPDVPIMADPQYFTRGDFDWSQTHLWKNNPRAVKYHEDHLMNRS